MFYIINLLKLVIYGLNLLSVMKEFIYINGKKSVEIERIKSDQEGVDETIDCNIYIDSNLHKFDEGTSYDDKLFFNLRLKHLLKQESSRSPPRNENDLLNFQKSF